MSEKTVRFSVELPEAVFKMVCANAKEAGISVEEYVAAWIEIRMPEPKEGDKFWKFIRRAALRVSLWPSWKKGGTRLDEDPPGHPYYDENQ